MANSLIFAAAFLTTFVFIQCDEPSTGLDSSLPMLASGKRQHNIMRFGKRPAGGHSLIHFGKREEPQHRFLFMGKRTSDEPDLFPFLQRDDNSYKRGHTIMRFGKRAPPPGSHSFIRFGKREEDGEEDKRSPSGHSMMYFGKRADGHNMMYFGKRGGHSMMYFGKRANELEPNLYVPDEDKTSAAEDLDESKRGSHSMIHFGKRLPAEEDIKNQLPVFWGPEVEEKRDLQGFGKKAEGSRGSHAMIHFGKRSVSARTKREVEEDDPLFIRPPAALMWEDVDGPSLLEYGEPDKKDGSKNVFLRFG